MDLDNGVLVVETMQIDSQGRLTPTGGSEEIAADLVIRSIGYRGEGLPGVPFDEDTNVIPSVDGAVIGLENCYVAGWIRRGPSGIIGTNKKDAVASINTLFQDRNETQVSSAAQIDQLLQHRHIDIIDFEGWKRIDAREKELGGTRNRDRTTIHDRQDLIDIGLGR
jgi:ferredoxin--NADP+ reductase